jgi:hypothetical protein
MMTSSAPITMTMMLALESLKATPNAGRVARQTLFDQVRLPLTLSVDSLAPL